MIGSIIGDIVGSVYEFNNIKTKEFEFFHPQGSFTDDSILTIATADWILNGGEIATYYAKYAEQYPWPMGGYGGGFKLWSVQAITKQIYRPYNSYGNGSAMRVSPVGWTCNTKEEVLALAKKSAECTHNHPEGIKGAQATALAIMMARQGHSKEEIRTEIEQTFAYDLQFTCEKSVPPTPGAVRVKTPFHKPSLHSWMQKTLKTPSATQSLLVETATPSEASPAALPKHSSECPQRYENKH